MSKPDRHCTEAFLAAVRRQIRSLDKREQLEILEELAGHLRDARASLLTDGVPETEAETRAVVAMGDPAAVGQRIRDEHLRRGLPLREALLAGLPLLLAAVLFTLMPLTHELREMALSRQGVEWYTPLVPVLVIGLCFWKLRHARHYWQATLAGILGVIGLITLSWLSGAIGLLLVATVVFLAVFVVLARWGSFRASFAVLGGIGTYGFYAWLGDGLSPYTTAIWLMPYLGVVALGVVPRRWHLAVAWAALVADWLTIVLYPVYHYSSQTNPMVVAWLQENPLTAERLLRMISPPVLLASVALLFSVQGISLLRARGGISGLTARTPRG